MNKKIASVCVIGVAIVVAAAFVALSRRAPPPTHDAPAVRLYRGKSLDAWSARLKSPRANERAEAVAAVSQFGPAARAAAGDLLEFFQESQYRSMVAEALVDIEADPKLVVPAMIKALETPNDSQADYAKQGDIERLREAAAYVIGRYGNATSDAVAALAKALPAVARAEESLARIGAPALPHVTPLLDGPDLTTRTRALGVIARIGPAARETVPRLTALLDEENSELRKSVFKALSRIGADAVPALSRELESADPERRYASATALLMMGSAGKEAEPVCAKALADPDERVRITAAATLVHLGAAKTDAFRVLVAGVTHSDLVLSGRSRTAVNRLGSAKSEFVASLQKALETADDEQRLILEREIADNSPPEVAVPLLVRHLGTRDWEAAAFALGRIGPDAAPALAALLEKLKSPSIDKGAVVYALGRLGPTARQAVPDLIALLRNGKGQLPGGVMVALGNIGTDAAVALPDLLFFLRTDDPKIRLLLTELTESDVNVADFYLNECRKGAVYALTRIGPAGVDALIEESNAPDRDRRIRALDGLAEAGPAVDAAADALRRLLGDADRLVRARAAKALWRVRKSPGDVLPVLTALLDSTPVENMSSYGDEYLVQSILDVIGEIGPAAVGAAPSVTRLLENGYRNAAEVLCRIEPDSELGLACLKQDLLRGAITPRSIRSLGTAARPLLPLLTQCTWIFDFRHDVADSLKELDKDEAAKIGIY
jgi:HEAT repeat protein